MKMLTQHRKKKKAFSLVELLVVTSIMMMLFGGVISLIRPHEEVSAKEAEYLTSMEIRHAIKVFEILFGREPSDIAEMISSGVLIFSGDTNNISLKRTEDGVLDVEFH